MKVGPAGWAVERTLRSSHESVGPIFHLQSRYLPEVFHVAGYKGRSVSQGDARNQEIAAADFLQLLVLSEPVEFRSRSHVHGNDFQQPKQLFATLQQLVSAH